MALEDGTAYMYSTEDYHDLEEYLETQMKAEEVYGACAYLGFTTQSECLYVVVGLPVTAAIIVITAVSAYLGKR